jgi:hypothetical protein
MPIKKKINYVVFDANGCIKDHRIGNIVATSDKADEIYIVADFDISTEETDYRSYARVKRSDGFLLGPYTLPLDQLTADEASEIGVEHLACRKLVIEKDMAELEGPVAITIVFDQVDANGKIVSTKATGMIVAHIYDAVPEILAEEEYNNIKTEMLPRDLGDLVTTADALITDVIIVNTNGTSKKITLAALISSLGIDVNAEQNVISSIKVNNTTLPVVNKTVNISVPTQASDINALPNTTKYAHTLETSYNGTNGVITITLKDQDGAVLSTQTVDLPLELLIDTEGSYYNNGIIYLKLSNGEFIQIDVAELIDSYTADGTTIVMTNRQFKLSDTYKSKIDNIEENAQVNEIEKIYVNEVEQVPDLSKSVNISINNYNIYVETDLDGRNILHIDRVV